MQLPLSETSIRKLSKSFQLHPSSNYRIRLYLCEHGPDMGYHLGHTDGSNRLAFGAPHHSLNHCIPHSEEVNLMQRCNSRFVHFFRHKP